MPRQHKQWRSIVKRISMLIAIPLVLTSTGYALFSKQLNVNANADKPTYNASQNLLVTYTRTVTGTSPFLYSYSVTVQNTSTTRTVSAWQVTFTLPAGYSSPSCTSATCTQASNVNTAVNTGTNGTINPSSSTTFSFSYRSTLTNYVFTTVTVSGTLVPIYQTVSGLTMTAVAGTRTKNGNKYTWPYTITVTNSSGQNLAGWRITATWSATETVSSMPATVNYTTTTSQITMTSTQAINTGTNFQFVPNFTSTNITWLLSGYSVQGQF